MNILSKYLLLFLVFLSQNETGFSQLHYDTISVFRVKDYPSSMFQIKYDSSRFGDYTIEVVHVLNVSYPGIVDSTHPSELTDALSCKGWLFLKKGTKTVQTMCYANMDAVGGCSGIYIPEKQPRQDYFLVAKYGDYNGNTILIHKDGTITNLPGGFLQISPDNRYLFSNFDSDQPGVTIFDFDSHKILLTPDSSEFDSTLREPYIQTCYYKNHNYMARVFTDDEEGENPDTLHITVATYDFKKNMLIYTKANKDFFKSSDALPDYTPNDVTDGHKSCNCGR